MLTGVQLLYLSPKLTSLSSHIFPSSIHSVIEPKKLAQLSSAPRPYKVYLEEISSIILISI